MKRLTNDGYVWSSLVVFARRAVPAVGAHVRHRHDHREEAVARRLRRSDRCGRPAGGAPINLTASWDLEPNAPRWSADSQSRLLHRREGRHDARVPRRGARRRAGRAGHDGRAPSRQRHLRQGDDAHRLQRRHLREPVRSVDREHRRHRREAADRSASPTSAPRSASRRPSASPGRATTAPRSKAC